jgi:subtilisin-like proprotein convertase family protein
MVSTTSPSGVVSDSTEQIGHEGWRAFGTGPDWLPSVAGSSWLQYKFPTTTEVIAFAITPATAIVGLQSQFKLQGSDDGAAWDDLSPTLSSNFIDGARQQFLLQAPDTYLYFRLTMATSADNGNSFVAQTGVALLELLDKNPNSGITKTATATSQTSQADANSKAYNAAKALADAALAQTGCVTIYTSTASFTARCAVGQFDGGNSQGFTASATAQSMVSQTDADNKALTAATTAANAGLHCNGSNNQQAISIIPGAVGSPYPSVEYISSTTPISRVTVNIKQMDYGNPVNLTLLLVSPTGKGVCLMSNCFSGTAMFPSTFSLDSTAISLIPANSPGGFGPGLNGAYLPTNYSASPITPPLPAPQISYPGSFAALMGDNPQGSWSLWVFTSAAAVPVAQIAHGWSITLS